MVNVQLSRQAFSLILRIMNSDSRWIIGSLLFDCYPGVANELVDGGWLMPDKMIGECLIDCDEAPADIVWREDMRCYCYFSLAFYCWKPVDMNRVRYHKVDMEKFLSWLGELCMIRAKQEVVEIIEHVFSYLGIASVRGERCHLYFLHCLQSGEALSLLQQKFLYENGHVPAVLLSSSENVLALLDKLPVGMVAMPLKNLLRRDTAECLLDKAVLVNLAQQGQAEYNDARYVSPVHFSKDYRQVKWRGQWYSLTKKQSAVVGALAREGGRAHKDLLCAEAETNQKLLHLFRNRVNGQFVMHPLWKTLITSDSDGCYILNN